MVNKFLGLSADGYLCHYLYFGTLILIPSRPLIKIATTILADSWKENDLENIHGLQEEFNQPGCHKHAAFRRHMGEYR